MIKNKQNTLLAKTQKKQALVLLDKILTRTKGIPIIVYKGIDLVLNYYPPTQPRFFFDIDLCVHTCDYFHIKKIISRLPGIILLHSESLFLNKIQGHALFWAPQQSLAIELHVAKDPQNIWEYITTPEHLAFFQDLQPTKIFRHQYYSLSRAEYLYVIVKQFLKKVSLGEKYASENTLQQIISDFSFILSNTTIKDWSQIKKYIYRKKIFMRLREYSTVKTWGLILALTTVKETDCSKEMRAYIAETTSTAEDFSIKETVEKIRQGKTINSQQLLERQNVFLLFCRLPLIVAQHMFFKARQRFSFL